jgi:hypothetical protein
MHSDLGVVRLDCQFFGHHGHFSLMKLAFMEDISLGKKTALCPIIKKIAHGTDKS